VNIELETMWNFVVMAALLQILFWRTT